MSNNIALHRLALLNNGWRCISALPCLRWGFLQDKTAECATSNVYLKEKLAPKEYYVDFRNGRRGMRSNLLKEMICKLHMNDNGFISSISMWKQFHKTVFVIGFQNWIPELVFEYDLHLGQLPETGSRVSVSLCSLFPSACTGGCSVVLALLGGGCL
ncbi:Hypothetical_protein [Hexamita inflata]|uniref:Hypothetical_protein n=1 Tax=Hexamita inflata TaxID=28002 RepID=A0AA86U8Q7_9EUKA|nr:Hypothetical protein HINF_LOCUS29462 [Hexamita inflata]